MIFSLVICMMFFSNFAFAASFSQYQANGSVGTSDYSSSDDENNATDNTDKLVGTIKDGAEKAADTVNSLAYTIVEQVSDKSLPICVLLILWGAILYFILGIRNLYKKRQGMLLMWGAFTFLVIAKIVNFVFWFFTRIG